MAKRKTARPAARTRTPGARTRAARGSRTTRKTTGTKTLARRPARATKKASARTASAKTAARGRTPSKPAAKGTRRAAAKRKAPAGRPRVGAPASALRQPTGKRPAVTRGTAPKSAPPKKQFGKRGPGSRRQQIERDRRFLEETVPTPPSSLDLDHDPSAARSGRAEMEEALSEHTAAGPAITAGDVDADWESAYATGDEAPGGDMPTPDQAVVEEIGTAMGVEYNDDEELKGVDKIEERDRHRWELDPASSEDYRDRARRRP
jgi:Family of unknown function (DUF6335)